MPPVPSPLISPETLAQRLGDPSLRIVDSRWYLGRPGDGRRAYEAGHIPGAVFVDIDSDLTAPTGPGRHPMPEAAAFARRMGEVGIGSANDVVVYDDVGGWVASRLWWMLEDLGHSRVAVLDGGYPAWLAAGLPTTTEIKPLPEARFVPARTFWRRVIDRDTLKPRLGEVLLLDARAGPRYRGESEPIDTVAGHIPTAVSAPSTENLAPDGRHLSAKQLRARFKALGAEAEGPGREGKAVPEVVTSCGSGITACHNALAMRIAGLPDPILYPGSYSDWTRAGHAVATGSEPGERPA
ncbi:MAG: sulfurtransferase [Chloroflexota bacterium]|nr:sulfurtransferase [Chloroflexota bacterium]